MFAAAAAVVFGVGLVAARPMPHPSPLWSNGHHDRHHNARRDSLPGFSTLATLSYSPKIGSTSYVALTKAVPYIIDNAISVSSHSWEYGVLTETLLEVYAPNLAPFDWLDGALGNPDFIPNTMCNLTASILADYDFADAPKDETDSNLNNYLDPATAKQALSPQPLVNGDGALGDPAALGPAAWVLAHYADQLNTSSIPNLGSEDAYAWAVGNQLAYLNNGVHSDNGTMSQRESYFELWADMGYMIPPFIAYVGLTTKNTTLLHQALTQWTDESSALLDTSTNLFRHVNSFDPRFWATGNAWMLLGLMRVLASIDSAGFTDQFASTVTAAENTAATVFTALFDQIDGTGRLPNYMLQDDASLAVADTAGTAGVLAAFYRFRIRRPDLAAPLLTKAGAAFDAVAAKVGSDYWVTDVVDPNGTQGFVVRAGVQSPEAQCFVALMWAARSAAQV